MENLFVFARFPGVAQAREYEIACRVGIDVEASGIERDASPLLRAAFPDVFPRADSWEPDDRFVSSAGVCEGGRPPKPASPAY